MPKAQKLNPQTSEERNQTGVLDPNEVVLCKQFAAGEPPWSQRAQALLAINDGTSAEAAAEASGLRTTQVNFWLNKFHKIGMGIFPEELLKTAENISPAAVEQPPDNDLVKLADPDKNKKKKKKNKPGKDKQGKSKKKKNKSKKNSGKAKKK